MAIPTFGTDGIRGRAETEITEPVAAALGLAAAEVLGGSRFVIGADTRQSGPALAAALSRGIATFGVEVEDLGVLPTPAVAWVSAHRNVPAAMISASHNPYHDNGIKLFAAGGMKLRDDVEARIQQRYLERAEALTGAVAARSGDAADSSGTGAPLSASGDDGSPAGPHMLSFPRTWHPAAEGWMDSVVASVGERALRGLKLVVDCANGAAHATGPEVFRRLGAEVLVIGAEPNGVNINVGVGSTSPLALAEAVVAQGAAAGLAFDGDADRLIAVDQYGDVVDGDRVLALLAIDWAASGRLADNTVVVTVMTNLGFHRAMADAGIKVVSTAVGDRHVLAALDDQGLSLGGEQSGHIICRDLATTGDGVLAGVQLLDMVARRQRPLAQLAAEVMDTVPQLLQNVVLPARNPRAGELIATRVAEIEREFGDDGRVVVRPSGTEPLLRIMVEHIDHKMAEEACRRLVADAHHILGMG